MKTYNIAPYFDDFEEFKNYHQILFKPGVAVQARELTQIQTILRNQIEKFGKSIFSDGSIVLPGNSYSKTDVDYVTLVQSVGTNFNDINIGDTVQSSASGVTAKVLGATLTPLGKRILTLSYLSSGSITESGEEIQVSTFQPGEIITIVGSNGTLNDMTVSEHDTDIGKCAMAFINDGVYFVNGAFVSVQKQSVIINPDNINAPLSASVYLQIDEKIITLNQDQSLLDPAQGYNNYAAPGSDRIRITLTLKTVDLSNTTEDFSPSVDIVELMRYKNGVLLEHNNSPKYSELDKALAKRMHDQSGDYIVEGFDLDVAEALRTPTNGGIYTPDTGNGSTDDLSGQVVYRVSPGEGYVDGFSSRLIYRNDILVNKPRDKTEIKRISRSIVYGNYVLIRPWGGITVLRPGGEIKFIGKDNTLIATATFTTMDYYVGDEWGAGNRIDKLYFSDIVYVSGQDNLDLCTQVRFSEFDYLIGDLVSELKITGPTQQIWPHGESTISPAGFNVIGYSQNGQNLYINNVSGDEPVPLSGTVISTATASATIKDIFLFFSESNDSPIHYLGQQGLKSTKNQFGQSDISITRWEVITFAASSTQSSTVSAGGVIVGVDSGIMTAYNQNGSVPMNQFSVNPTASGLIRSSGDSSLACTVYVQVRKEASAPRMKYVSNMTQSVTTPNNGKLSRIISLNRYDAVELKSVVIDGVDRKNDFRLTRNTSKYSYKNSYIELRPGVSALPPNTSALITFVYLRHDSASDSNYFSADSYDGVPIDYIESVSISGRTVSLRDCLDFRSTDIKSPIVSGSSITTSATFYLGRYDAIVLNKDGKITVIEGTASATPVPPLPPAGGYILHLVYLPPYCYNINDIKPKRVAVNAYSMTKIEGLSKRINSLEEFSMLNFAELQTLQSNIIDASTGLDKFKTGYVVENVQDPFVIADVAAPGFHASCSPTLGIYCGLDKENVDLSLFIDNTQIDGVDFANKFLTRSYTEEVFASNSLSSSTININPFSIVNYEGSLKLEPNQDMWAEYLSLPEDIVNRHGVTRGWSAPLPQATNTIETGVTGAITNGVAYDLGNNKIAYTSGPTTLSLDTIMGWESRAKASPPKIEPSASELEAMKAGLFISGISTPQNTTWDGSAGDWFGVNYWEWSGQTPPWRWRW